MSDLVKLYNPANASALTSEEIDGLQKLTSEEIKELAKEYPNVSMQRAYLLIADSKKPVEKQLPTLSSFENLWNLREKNGQRSWVAIGFKGTYKPSPVQSSLRIKKTEVVDLSETELLSLPGFKQNGVVKKINEDMANLSEFLEKDIEPQPEKVKVTKIRKTKKTATK